ncbi:MAG: RsbRD N-terminal domain-containing protein [Pyrinomonadaceae bacterium]
MSDDRFAALIRKHEEAITRAFVEEVYKDRRTDLQLALSYEQLINFLPDLLDDLARLLDKNTDYGEIIDTARRLRAHAQVRFHQGVLLDEVARELSIFRNVFSDFLCREAGGATREDAWEMCRALRLADRLIDELSVQATVIYAASMRPPIKTRTSIWPPPRRRKTDFSDESS